MHPAYSVIFFTTASGAGYGLLALLGILNAVGALPTDKWFGLTGFMISLGLITLGLLSSTFHLGHPERVWRAFSQWRSSWLSREGVLAVATYIPAGLFAIGWVFLEQTTGVWLVFGVLAGMGAVLTIYCTSMIYASLKAIPAWTHELVPTIYLVLGFATGGLLLLALLRLFSYENATVLQFLTTITIVFLAIATLVKLKYWKALDNAVPASDLASATGLGAIGTVRVLEKPHTSENYLQQEMGFKVARKHAQKLRRITIAALFISPLLLLFISVAIPALAPTANILAVLTASLGIITERWLFFAEAKHVVMSYYEG